MSASSKALATTDGEVVNVVPVSVITVTDATITLYDFFMGKTVMNIGKNNQIALAVWEGLSGIQIKGTARYETVGSDYETAVVAMKVRFPERTLRGIVIMTPSAIYDISAGVGAGALMAGS